MKKINIIELFSWCWWLADGFLQTGYYNTLAAIDWEIKPVETLRKRFSEKYNYNNVNDIVIHYDLQQFENIIDWFNDEKYWKHEWLKSILSDEKVSIISWWPPCQAYSIAWRVRDKKWMKDDYRNYLFESYVKFVDYYKPEYFVFENVEWILSASPWNILIIDRIREAFNEIWYNISDDLRRDALFDISEYWIPQKRKRVIIFWAKNNKRWNNNIKKFYKEMNNQKKEIVKSEYAFSWLPKLYPSEVVINKQSHVLKNNDIFIKNHEPRFHSKRDIDIFNILTLDIKKGIFKYWSTSALIKLYEEKTWKKSKFHKYHVIRSDKPSNTIPAHLYKDWLRHIHPDPEQSRTITVREAARLQSFCDDFEFLWSKWDQYKMVWNAVPPKFAKIIGNTINNLFFNQA